MTHKVTLTLFPPPTTCRKCRQRTKWAISWTGGVGDLCLRCSWRFIRAGCPSRPWWSAEAKHPEIGSRWIWERGKPHAEETIVVTAVRWNGEEWWVGTVADGMGMLPAGEVYWNDLSRFWEAVSPLD